MNEPEVGGMRQENAVNALLIQQMTMMMII